LIVGDLRHAEKLAELELLDLDPMRPARTATALSGAPPSGGQARKHGV
jgi:hypothetical protein